MDPVQNIVNYTCKCGIFFTKEKIYIEKNSWGILCVWFLYFLQKKICEFNSSKISQHSEFHVVDDKEKRGKLVDLETQKKNQ